MIARLAIALVVLAALLPANASAATLSPPGDIYLAMGDSLAVGVEAPGNNDGQPGYPALLLERLRSLNPAIELVNVGVAGETSSTLISGGQLAAAESAINAAESAGKCVGFITLDIGGNDFGRILTGEDNPGSAISTFSANLTTILNRLQAAANSQVAGCTPRIVLMDYYNPYPGLPIPPSDQPLADIYLPSLNSIIRSAAAARGLAVTNVESAFRGREPELIYVNQGIYTNPLLRLPFTPWFETNVDFHPRPAGHQVIADQMWAAAGLVPPVPTLAELPDLILPNVALLAPWTCGVCAPDSRQQQVLNALPEPDARNIEWLGAVLWNRVARPLICWNIAALQVAMNAYSATLNQLWIPAFNQLFRLLYTLLFWLTSAFQSWWLLGEDIRLQLWSINGSLLAQQQSLAQLAANEVGELSTIAEAWILVFSHGIEALRYLVALYLGTVPQLLAVMTDLEANKPAQLVALDNFWLFAALVGTLEGVATSRIGWWLTAEIALFYVSTALTLMDEVAEV